MTRSHTKPSLPSKDDLLAFIGQQSGKIGTREVARAFGLKNADRAILKRMLRELAGLLADEGEEVVFGGKGRLGMGTCHENKIREQNSLTS